MSDFFTYKECMFMDTQEVPDVMVWAHVAGRLDPDLDPEAQAKPPPPIYFRKCEGGKPRLPGLTQSLCVLRCGLWQQVEEAPNNSWWPKIVLTSVELIFIGFYVLGHTRSAGCDGAGLAAGGGGAQYPLVAKNCTSIYQNYFFIGFYV
jgi:hypothetical protein